VTPNRRASGARSAAGRHGRKISGSAHVAMTGTRSTPEASAQHAHQWTIASACFYFAHYDSVTLEQRTYLDFR
jgi:hypothetical protein